MPPLAGCKPPPANSLQRRGTCFKLETGYGDERTPWFIFWRLRSIIGIGDQRFAEAHRFETRCDGVHALNPADTVRLSVLDRCTVIEPEEWTREWERWQVSATQPWNVE